MRISSLLNSALVVAWIVLFSRSTYNRYQLQTIKMPERYIVNGFQQMELNRAVSMWEAALGHPVPRPALVSEFTTFTCGSSKAIACSVDYVPVIRLTPLFFEDKHNSYTETMILAHEEGHILGVPHIEDDMIMDEGTSQDLTFPPVLTADDVALVRLRDRSPLVLLNLR